MGPNDGLWLLNKLIFTLFKLTIKVKYLFVIFSYNNLGSSVEWWGFMNTENTVQFVRTEKIE